MTHTSTPWEWEQEPGMAAEVFVVIDGLDCVIAEVYDGHGGDAADNAAFIVRACNTHDELVAALEAAQQFFAWYDAALEGVEFADATRQQVDAAIARAKGEQHDTD